MIYHTVYCTTNKVNGKQYVGIHSTTNLNDGYLGSGTLMQEAIEKYGEKNFSKKILFQCDSREEACWLESIIVNPRIVYKWGGGLHFYNLVRGGQFQDDEHLWCDYNVFRRKKAKRDKERKPVYAALYIMQLKAQYPHLKVKHSFRGWDKPITYFCSKCNTTFRAVPTYVTAWGCSNCD